MAIYKDFHNVYIFSQGTTKVGLFYEQMFVIGSCIPNLNLKFWVGFRVETSFRESRRDELNIIFSLLLKILLKGSFQLIFVFFAIFSQFFAKIRVGMSFCELGRVQKKLEQLVPTLIFEKRTFPKLAKTKSLVKAVFRRASVCNHSALNSLDTSFFSWADLNCWVSGLYLLCLFAW